MQNDGLTCPPWSCPHVFPFFPRRAFGTHAQLLFLPFLLPFPMFPPPFAGTTFSSLGCYAVWLRRNTTGETKYISMPNFQAGVVMYFSYMMLFLQYALGRFLPKAKGGNKVNTSFVS